VSRWSDSPSFIKRFTHLQRKPRGVKPASRFKNCLQHRPGLVLAAVFVCVLLQAGSVFGSSVSRANGIDLDEHAQHCKCRTKCRGSSCCCGPAATTARRSTSEPVSDRGEVDAGPCLSSAPCGDSGLPIYPPAGPDSKIATLSTMSCEHPGTRDRLFPFVSSCILPARRASRIDKPPRGLFLA
jgi:hypothetical protein